MIFRAAPIMCFYSLDSTTFMLQPCICHKHRNRLTICFKDHSVDVIFIVSWLETNFTWNICYLLG